MFDYWQQWYILVHRCAVYRKPHMSSGLLRDPVRTEPTHTVEDVFLFQCQPNTFTGWAPDEDKKKCDLSRWTFTTTASQREKIFRLSKQRNPGLWERARDLLLSCKRRYLLTHCYWKAAGGRKSQGASSKTKTSLILLCSSLKEEFTNWWGCL